MNTDCIRMPSFTREQRDNHIRGAVSKATARPYFWSLIIKILLIINKNEKMFSEKTRAFACKHTERIRQQSTAPTEESYACKVRVATQEFEEAKRENECYKDRLQKAHDKMKAKDEKLEAARQKLKTATDAAK